MNEQELMLWKAGKLWPGFNLGQFNVKTVVYDASASVPVISGCYGYLAVNNCDVTIFVDDFPLLPPLVPGTSGAAFGFMDITRVYASGSIDVKILTGATVLQVIISQIFKLG